MVGLARFFKALSDERRLRIVSALLEGEQEAGWLTVAAGRDRTTVSRHLQLLVEADILQRRRDGRRVIYSIASAGMAGRLRRVGIAPPVTHPELEGRIRDFLTDQY